MSGNPSDLEARIRRLERLASGTDRRVKAIEDALSLAGPMIRTIGRIVGGSTPVESEPPGGICVACGVPATFKALDVVPNVEHTMALGSWFVGSVTCDPPNYGWSSAAIQYTRSGSNLWWRFFLCCPSSGSAGTVYRAGFATLAAANNPTTPTATASGTLVITSCGPLDMTANATAGSIPARGVVNFYE